MIGGELVGSASGATVTSAIQQYNALTRQDDTVFRVVANVNNSGPVAIYRAGSIHPMNVVGYLFPGNGANIPLPSGATDFYYAGTDNDYIAVMLVR